MTLYFMFVDLWRPNLTLLCDFLIMNFMTKVLLLRSGLMLLVCYLVAQECKLMKCLSTRVCHVSLW